MPNNDGEEERADGGVETVDFDALGDDDLPEWATGEASAPGTEPTHSPEPTDTPEPGTEPESEPDAPSPEPDDGADDPVDAATAVNFANVETGASASVAVGWSRTEADYGDTGGTSIDPDLDDVDPTALLDEIDDGAFPRPGAPDADTDTAAPAVASPATTGGGLTPDDPAVAFGLGAVVMLVAAIIYVLLSTTLPPAAAGLAIATCLVAASVVGLVYLADQRF
ncbi:hypothetical protein [Haloglomus salinum]|jgi:hypothetical protein|uniref:hypothetical protein n=1 Tax=Haloglomus salinum TaxID=2962673 RepID=UPI0020C955AF|nr:hypothetical protein [Haloglomus salinum]